MLTLDDITLAGKRVLVREDFNVPIHNGIITDDSRIQAGLPTLERLLAAGAAVMVCSHLGRPEGEKFDPAFSLEPIAKALSTALKIHVRLIADWVDGVDVKPGELVLCENVRFNPGETENDQALSQKMAALCDVFVMDAFGTAHRAQASTVGVAEYAPIAVAGPLLTAEIEALKRALTKPTPPVVAVVGGSKISTKLKMLKKLLTKVDALIVGGGIANTFIAAKGYSVGKSLYEPDLISEAQQLMQMAEAAGKEIPIPIDVVVATEFSEHAKAITKPVDQVQPDEMILDFGPKTMALLVPKVQSAKTILWNGPIGVFEFEAFSKGTRAIAQAIAESHSFSIAGGGDTVSAIEEFGVHDSISYISTGGGAFLKFIEGKTLPAVSILEVRARTIRT